MKFNKKYTLTIIVLLSGCAVQPILPTQAELQEESDRIKCSDPKFAEDFTCQLQAVVDKHKAETEAVLEKSRKDSMEADTLNQLRQQTIYLRSLSQ